MRLSCRPMLSSQLCRLHCFACIKSRWCFPTHPSSAIRRSTSLPPPPPPCLFLLINQHATLGCRPTLSSWLCQLRFACIKSCCFPARSSSVIRQAIYLSSFPTSSSSFSIDESACDSVADPCCPVGCVVFVVSLASRVVASLPILPQR